MSHVATIEIEVKDLDALADACKRLGCVLNRNQATYRWWGTSVGDYPLPAGFTAADLGKCEHCISLPGMYGKECFEVGVVRRRDGKQGFTLLWDFFGHRGEMMSARIGTQGEKLKQAYSVCAAKRQAQKQGFRVREQKLADGRIRLVCSK